MPNKSLYIHIPFCNKLCYYCDFNKVFYNTSLASIYINDLVKDINNDSSIYTTIYIGGGSPSSLNYEQLNLLLSSLSTHLDKDYEFSIELNPEDMDDKKIDILVKNKINRVSIGVQTFNDNLLKTINRNHNKDDVINLINKLHSKNIFNINLDLMFGIPNQSKDDIKNDLDIMVSLDIPHISTYALLIEPNTYFAIHNTNALDDDTQATYYEYICKYLKEKGYIHYEISNFSKPNYMSKHNLVYWEGKEYKALGAGSSGYENHSRYTYTKSIKNYIEHKTIVSCSYNFLNDIEYEYIILHLRLKDGINIKEFNKLFSIDFKEKYSSQIDALLDQKLCILENDLFYVKEENFFILNRILTYF